MHEKRIKQKRKVEVQINKAEEKTKGIKKLIPPLGSTRNDILSYSKYGENEAASETEVIDYISVRVKSLSIDSDAGSKIFKYSLNMVETV